MSAKEEKVHDVWRGVGFRVLGSMRQHVRKGSKVRGGVVRRGFKQGWAPGVSCFRGLYGLWFMG